MLLDKIKAIRTMSLLEEINMSEQFIRDVLDCRRVQMTLEEALRINNMQIAVENFSKYVNVSFALAESMEETLGRDVQQINGLRTRDVLTMDGAKQPVGRERTLQRINESMCSTDRYTRAAEILKFFCEDLPFEHSNASIGYLCACMCMGNPVYIDDIDLASAVIKAARAGDTYRLCEILCAKVESNDTVEYEGKTYRVANIISSLPSSIRSMYATDYECASAYVSQYAAQMIL